MKRFTLILLAGLPLAACSEFTAEPQRTATRAVRGPEAVSNPENEFTGSTATGVPILEADLPRNKDDTLRIHTAADYFQATTRAATQPATRPGEPLAPPPSFTPSHSTVNLIPTGTRPANP